MLTAYIVFILEALDTTMDIKGQIITGIYYSFQSGGKKSFKADGKFNRLCTNYRLKCLSHHFFFCLLTVLNYLDPIKLARDANVPSLVSVRLWVKLMF